MEHKYYIQVRILKDNGDKKIKDRQVVDFICFDVDTLKQAQDYLNDIETHLDY